MQLTAALHRRLAWANVPATLLIALLQRTPLLRVAAVAEESVIASPISGVLRSAVAAAALGALHSMAGATTVVASTPSPLAATVGKAITSVAFGINGGQLTASSWQVQSSLPPGLSFQGLTGPGFVNTANPILSGTPTASGSYQVVLEAWEDPNETGPEAPLFVYAVNIAASPVSFTLAPGAQSVATGRTVVFNALAAGTPAPGYQWTLNGSAAIPGATVTNDPILVITGASAADVGTITCTAANTAGSASSSATLAVAAAANPGYLTNLSGRGLVGSGAANALYGGFGISGTGTKKLLIRGMGPSIGPGLYFYIADALQSTQLTLYNSLQAVLAQNSPWGGTPALMAADALTGAYPPIATTSLDSMLYLPVATGSASAAVAGVGGATGDAVIELYDADSPPLSAKLTNVAVRAPVGTGGDILFGGFAIGGTTNETVLIRGIGPRLGLAPFNLSPVLAQPVLTLYLGATPTGYTNTGWGGDAALANAMATVGAYSLSPSSQDSLLLVTLPPGTYSAEVSGLNGTTGIAAVEVYEVY